MRPSIDLQYSYTLIHLSHLHSLQMSQFRQCVQAHTDWVNDLLLCNYNQTGMSQGLNLYPELTLSIVVSASSDGTVKAWSPHAAVPTDPITLGSHADYVRCLSLW